MLHLFNKAYIQTDDFIDSTVDRIVVSQNSGTPDEWRVSLGEVIHHTNTITNLVGPGKMYEEYRDLFGALAERSLEKPIVMYLDRQSFNVVISAWFKTLFKKIDSESAHKLVKSHFAREKLIGGLTLKDYYKFEAFQPTLDEFKAAFNQVEIDSNDAAAVIKEVKNGLSIEFLLSTYVATGEYKNQLKTAVKRMIERQLVQLVIETKFTTYRKALKDDFVSKMNLEVYDFDKVEDIVNDPVLAILNNSSFCQTPGASEHGKNSGISFKNITDDEINVLDTFINKVYPELEYRAYLKDYFKFVRQDELSDADLNAFIANEAATDEAFWSAVDLENINIYFIDHVLENVKNQKELQNYVIR